MGKIFLVGMGGFIGAALRYMISGYVQNLSQSAAFPHGTLAVNMIGCFFIGLLTHLVESQASISAEARLFLIVGLLGAFTTYSTFSNETFNLLRDQQWPAALGNMAIHLILGLLAVLIGRLAAVAVWK
jgi:CrcB protein